MKDKRLQSVGRRSAQVLLAALMAGSFSQPLLAQVPMSPEVKAQLSALKQQKAAQTTGQKKMQAQLWLSAQAAKGQAIPGAGLIYSAANDMVKPDTSGNVSVVITGTVTDALKNLIVSLGGSVQTVGADGNSLDAVMPLLALETLGDSADVKYIAPQTGATTNVGAITSQGYITHKANLVVNGTPYKGQGVKVGVLSDSALNIATLIASGDLPANTTTLPGQAGPSNGTNEGSAMMEIVSDMAPGAQLIFATAFTSATSFANNIRALRDAGCTIIVDDVSYFSEGAFQDGPIAKAVNDVTASGVLYFSSAGNSGSVTAGTAGVWEGDFNPGSSDADYVYHRFPGGLDYNVLTGASSNIWLKWSDPLGASSNDYDLLVLNSTGTTLLCTTGGGPQTGTQDPVEGCQGTFPAGSLVVIGNYNNAAPRALHLNTNRGRLNVATNGVTFGHNAGRNTVTVAATYWNSAKTGTKAFVGGAANPTESFSSDGGRRIFYTPDGTALTPGNLLFATNGGELLQKPDVTAADGVSTKTPGFLPFYGTSAAAPHAAGIAALVKSARPDYTNAQILAAMKATALDIRAPGADRDSGSGIVMALEAVNYALSH